MESFVAILVGIGLRILLPVGITIVVFILLRRLDRRWQKDALQLPVISPGSKPCWEIKACPQEKKNKCPAVSQPGVPCWQVFRKQNGVLKETCIGCEVFRLAPLPVRS